MEEINQALAKYYRGEKLTKKDFENLPKQFLLRTKGLFIQRNWGELPDQLKQDPEIREYRACMIHPYNEGTDQIDGPRPLIKYCHKCNEMRKL